jgi:hypothetical protein
VDGNQRLITLAVRDLTQLTLCSLPKHTQVRKISPLILLESAALLLATENAIFYSLDSG